LRSGVTERLAALPSRAFIDPAAVFLATPSLLQAASAKVTDAQSLSRTPVICLRF
jgi:hypothetical protein